MRSQQLADVVLPPVAHRQLAWFARYTRWYLQCNFHGLHLLRLSEFDNLEGLPLLVCLNHPSWWDPLVALYLSQRFFPERHHVAPIAAEGMAKYKFFERLGFFSIQPGTRQGAFRFLKIGQAALSRANGALWVTAQGEFTDVRVPVTLKPGIGHLASHLENFAMLPVAFEYSFWNERYPEAFACIGRPLIGRGSEADATAWTRTFRRSLQQTVDTLSDRVALREAHQFEPLFRGRAGVGGVYDFWRASKARLAGKRWQPEHGGN